MKPQPQPDVREVLIADIMPFVSRAREKLGFEQLRASIKVHGMKYPIGLRDISHLPTDERRRPDGGTYKYQRVWGEGRILAHLDLKRAKIWAQIGSQSEADAVGDFLTENLLRKPLPWAEKAHLIKADFDAGMTHEKIARKYFITVKHAQKLERILSKTGAGLETEVRRMSINDAEVLTALPAEHQSIIIETMRETGEREIQAIVRKARSVATDDGHLSKSALKKSIERVADDLKRTRDKLKLTRLHHSLGPMNLLQLWQDPAFRKLAEREGVTIKKLEALTK
jgi:ParB-like chromosome segregation protein Spo0J